jgi:nucleotide-binding universal stress UspA family protein
MFEKILVCLDGSELAEQILPYAVEQAKKFKSKVILIQAIAKPSSVISGTGPVTGPALQDQIKAEEDKATKYLSRMATKLQCEEIAAEYIAVEGAPGHEIVEYARENEVDLIAIATHGHSGIKRAILGSIADYVIRESHLPMLVIKPK